MGTQFNLPWTVGRWSGGRQPGWFAETHHPQLSVPLAGTFRRCSAECSTKPKTADRTPTWCRCCRADKRYHRQTTSDTPRWSWGSHRIWTHAVRRCIWMVFPWPDFGVWWFRCRWDCLSLACLQCVWLGTVTPVKWCYAYLSNLRTHHRGRTPLYRNISELSA